jgi:hypothetical protein
MWRKYGTVEDGQPDGCTHGYRVSSSPAPHRSAHRARGFALGSASLGAVHRLAGQVALHFAVEP